MLRHYKLLRTLKGELLVEGDPLLLVVVRDTLCRELPNLTKNTCGGGACILGSATPPFPRERNSKIPKFPNFWSFFLYYAYTL